MKTLILCLISIVASAQNKVGNLTLDSATFYTYLIDCYQHPDLKPLAHYDEIPKTGNPKLYWTKTELEQQRKKKLRKDSLYKLNRTDVINWTDGIFRNVDIAQKEDNMRYNSEIYHNQIGNITDVYGTKWYKVPRKPSEEDFIKWLAKRK